MGRSLVRTSTACPPNSRSTSPSSTPNRRRDNLRPARPVRTSARQDSARAQLVASADLGSEEVRHRPRPASVQPETTRTLPRPTPPRRLGPRPAPMRRGAARTHPGPAQLRQIGRRPMRRRQRSAQLRQLALRPTSDQPQPAPPPQPTPDQPRPEGRRQPALRLRRDRPGPAEPRRLDSKAAPTQPRAVWAKPEPAEARQIGRGAAPLGRRRTVGFGGRIRFGLFGRPAAAPPRGPSAPAAASSCRRPSPSCCWAPPGPRGPTSYRRLCKPHPRPA